MAERPVLDAFVLSLGMKTVEDHSRCVHACTVLHVCPTCGHNTFVLGYQGRWDPEANDGKGATALPFEPVAVSLHCGHAVGDVEASKPSNRPGMSGGDA